MKMRRNTILGTILTILMLFSWYAVNAADWTNPNPQSGADMAGQLLLKHESNMTDLYSSPSGKLNLLKKSHASSTSPATPSTGQLWYDSTNQYMKIYDVDWTTVRFYNAHLLDGYDTSLNAGANTIPVRDSSGGINAAQFRSTAATNTPPMTVSSFTLVTNFNADMVDGYHVSPSGGVNMIPVGDANGVITGVRSYQVQSFTSSGSFNVPSGVSKIWLFGRGGGAGGGGAAGGMNGTGGGGSGGGAGAMVSWYPVDVSGGQTYSVTIGTGGGGGAYGGPGANGSTGTVGTATMFGLSGGANVIILGGGVGGNGGQCDICGQAGGTAVNCGAITFNYSTATGGTGGNPGGSSSEWWNNSFWIAGGVWSSLSSGAGGAGAGLGTGPGGGAGGGKGAGTGGAGGAWTGAGGTGGTATANSGAGGGGGGGTGGGGTPGSGGAGAAGYLHVVWF